MCGICGIFSKNNEPPSRDLLRQMARQMKHRGPDDEGYWQEGNASLGFQRLSIIDIAGGHQPMANEDGTVQVVFNGEIYNHMALRAELAATGRHTLRTHSDTEVLLHLYEEHGDEFVHRLRGMFAFALWDSRRSRALLARDRLGKKPLVYADLPDAFLFASEIQGLLPYPSLPRDIDREAIDAYLSLQYIPSPLTIYRQVRKLPPGHLLVWENGTHHIKRYWSPSFLPKATLSPDEGAAQLRDTLKESVRLRLSADVPVGAFLSGGKDSAAVVALMTELSAKPVQTFSMGFPDAVFSELPYARELAKRLGCDHHEFMMTPDALALLPQVIERYGEPFADSSALAVFELARQTRQHVKVALSGDGGDELFAGYPRYAAMKLWPLLRRIPPALRRALGVALSSAADGTAPFSTIWRVRRLIAMGTDHPDDAYLDTLSFFREKEKNRLYASGPWTSLQPRRVPDYLNQILREAGDLSGSDPYLYTDLRSYLPDCLMVKTDIASMANSLEVRCPFLDQDVVELVGHFPAEWKLAGLFHPKKILDQAMRSTLPSEVFDRPKRGFSLPMSTWFRGPRRQELAAVILSQRASGRGLFKSGEIQRLLDEHTRGYRDHGYQLWALLVLELWFERFANDARFS